MSENGTTLTYTREITAAPKQVYRAFTNAAALLEWLGDNVEADAREGGRFYVWWNQGYYASGLYKHLEENKKVAFTWQGLDEPGQTLVKVLIEPKDGGSQLTLRHTGLGAGKAWEAVQKGLDENWPAALDNLKSVLETGVDRRLYDRPMLGFFVGGMVDENLRERLGIAVDHGVHVSGLVEGMGAQKSGLQANDVITAIEGVEIHRFQDLSVVLAQHKGGDVVNTIVQRGNQKLTLDVELSKRPVPEFPPAPADLASLGKEVYTELLKTLKTELAGVSEQEASHKPSPGEWSVKEVLAHLLVSERWSQAAWALHPEGNKLPQYTGGNRMVEAIAKTYDLESLLKALKYSVKLQLNLIKSLPEDYAARKSSYFLTASNFEQGTRSHFEEHTAQIKAAVAAARQSQDELVPA